jgi:4-alpha-glucanotransferase
MAKSNKAIMAELKNTQKMLMGILQASSQVAQAAAQQGKRVQQTAITQAKQQMAINLSKAQQAHGLPDDSAQDFMTFAAERGYTLEDFVNPELAYSVVGDFKNARNSPEMERLRAIAQKRQAFTASVGSAPGGQQAGAAPAQTSFDSLANSVLARRQQFNQ